MIDDSGGFETYSEPSISTSSNSPFFLSLSFPPFPSLLILVSYISPLSLFHIFAKNECERTQVFVDSVFRGLESGFTEIEKRLQLSSKTRFSGHFLSFASFDSDTKSVHLSTEMNEEEEVKKEFLSRISVNSRTSRVETS